MRYMKARCLQADYDPTIEWLEMDLEHSLKATSLRICI